MPRTSRTAQFISQNQRDTLRCQYEPLLPGSNIREPTSYAELVISIEIAHRGYE